MTQERYAVAKLTLFSFFDQADAPDGSMAPVVPSASEMHAHLQLLGRA
jgi:hypothetical protein